MLDRKLFFMLILLLWLILPATNFGYTNVEIDQIVDDLQKGNEHTYLVHIFLQRQYFFKPWLLTVQAKHFHLQFKFLNTNLPIELSRV